MINLDLSLTNSVQVRDDICDADDPGQFFVFSNLSIVGNRSSFPVFLHLFLLFAEFAIRPSKQRISMCHADSWGTFLYFELN
jgi:hypothetical protein